jgi:hypothetical protein
MDTPVKVIRGLDAAGSAPCELEKRAPRPSNPDRDGDAAWNACTSGSATMTDLGFPPGEVSSENTLAAAGPTTVTSGTVCQGGSPPSPGGLRLGSAPTCYDVAEAAALRQRRVDQRHVDCMGPGSGSERLVRSLLQRRVPGETRTRRGMAGRFSARLLRLQWRLALGAGVSALRDRVRARWPPTRVRGRRRWIARWTGLPNAAR